MPVSTAKKHISATLHKPQKMTSGKYEGGAADEVIKKFVFSTLSRNQNASPIAELEILIPDRPKAGYSLRYWPCASILAWFIWDRRYDLADKRILEIGAGTALPGILAAKCGAHVTLSDSCTLPKTLANIQRCCTLNGLVPGKDVQVVGLSWGLLLNSVATYGPIDYIIGSDCFYDPTVFEDILVTISSILDDNKAAKFIFSYQERSTDWSIEALLKKWDLKCVHINIERIGEDSGVNLQDFMAGHSIYLLEISR